ncbi:MAG TPA: GWxTD domain-containing protein [Candidatus Eisenbacteria bacterium]|nr:GWxTD domain-containing protein [Candidatus Eisenbacteria bacterium]
MNGPSPAPRRTGSPAAAALLGVLLLAAATGRAQYPNPGPAIHEDSPVPGTSATRPRFAVDATLQPGDGGADVRIDYRMGRDELLFERSSAGYHASYEIRVIFYKAKGGAQVTGEVFQKTVKVATYADTRLRGADLIDHVILRAPAGKYRVQVVVTDLVAERASGTEIPFEVPSATRQSLWFSDLSLGTVADSAASAAAPRDRFVPVPGRRFGLDLPLLAVLGEVVDSRAGAASAGEEPYRIASRVVNELQEVVWKGDTTIVRVGPRTPFLLRPRLRSLEAGTYRVILELTSPTVTPPGKKKPEPIRRERPFEVEQTSANLAWETKGSIEVLRYIANPDERNEIDRLDGPDARKTFWENFWRRRDPTPDTDRNEQLEEFYRRVQYSNQHFAVGTPGWRTDMGRIYIQNGAPDEVVRNPFNFDRPPEEIWYYYKDQYRFVFIDRDGFGRFELDAERSRQPASAP